MRPGGLEDQTSEDFDFVMAVNCKAPVFLCKAALPYLKQTKEWFHGDFYSTFNLNINLKICKKGNIVNISSTSSFTPFQGILSYNMSKAALDHFTRTMATNLMFEGVKVNSVNPATVRTDIHYSKGNRNIKTFSKNYIHRLQRRTGPRILQQSEQITTTRRRYWARTNCNCGIDDMLRSDA